MDFNVINTALTGIAKLLTTIKSNFTDLYKTTSLPEITSLMRVEPIHVISQDLLTASVMPDVSQAMLALFCGYYLQAINILTQVRDVEVIRILDKLNPNRDDTGFFLAEGNTGWAAGTESYGLNVESFTHKFPTKKTQPRIVVGTEDDPVKTVNEISSLSVGRMLDVTVCVTKDDDKDETIERKLQIAVRLMASMVPDSTLTGLLAKQADDKTFIERWHAWRSGRIAFIRDLILCQDIIDDWKRCSMGDKSGTAQEIMNRVTAAKKYGLLTKNPSLVSASTLYTISKEMAKSIEYTIGGPLSNANARKKIFEGSYAMIIAVVDQEFEQVIFYTRGQNQGTRSSFKELKKAQKGPDIMEFMKAFTQGSPLSI